MVYRRLFVAAESRTWSQLIVLICLLRVPSTNVSHTSTRSPLPAVTDDDAFTFKEPGRSSVDYLQPPLPPEVGHVVSLELEFRTHVGSAPLLHRDPRRQPNDDVIMSSPGAASRHVTGCTREAEIQVQLKIGMLHVSATYDRKHVDSVSVGQGKMRHFGGMS